jgi:adenine-specific DNA-methyltransferase
MPPSISRNGRLISSHLSPFAGRVFVPTLNRKGLFMLNSYLNQVTFGDCVELLPQLPDACIDLVLTDPPYVVNYQPRDRRRCVNDRAHWLEPAFRQVHRVLKPNCFCVSFYGWPWVDRFMAVWKACGFRPVSHLVWPKKHSSRKGYTEGHHEVAYLLAKGRPPKPRHPPCDVLPWEYTGNVHHPNEKPVVALLPLIEAFSRPGDVVLDAFAGSGTTGLAARKLNRRFILFEKDKTYYETARQRLFRR